MRYTWKFLFEGKWWWIAGQGEKARLPDGTVVQLHWYGYADPPIPPMAAALPLADDMHGTITGPATVIASGVS